MTIYLPGMPECLNISEIAEETGPSSYRAPSPLYFSPYFLTAAAGELHGIADQFRLSFDTQFALDVETVGFHRAHR